MSAVTSSTCGYVTSRQLTPSRRDGDLCPAAGRRAKGDLRAVATLSDSEIERIESSDKGEVTVPVVVTDSEGKEPIKAEMVWAWVPKKRD